MKLDWGDFFKDGRFSEYVVENIIRSFVERNEVFLDGGANEGRHTFVGLAAGASVVSIEPIPELVEKIKSKAQLEFPENQMLQVIQAALSNNCGTATFNYCPSRSTLSGLHARTRLEELEVQQISVEKVTIDQLVDRLGITHPSIIKLDLEGGEFDAIKGGGNVLSNTPVLIFEHGGKEGAKLYGYTNQDYYDYLVNLGYSVLQINGRDCTKNDFINPRHWNFCAINMDNQRHRELLLNFDYLTADAAQKMYIRHSAKTKF